MSGIPFEVERECLGATQYFERMEWLDGEVARRLQGQTEREVERSNRVRRPPPVYRPRDWVWVLRPKTGESDQKVETWWTGPVEVKKRVGDASYEVELHPGVLHAVHADKLKPFVCGEPVELFPLRGGLRPRGSSA